MWADTLLRAEQQHLLRLLAWSGLAVLVGTATAAVIAIRRMRSPLLLHFATQMAGWGVVIGIIGAVGWNTAHLRDAAGAARLERLVWMNVGLDAGYVAVGVAIASAAWILGRRVGGVGAGVAIVVHGLALGLLDLQFAAIISR